MQQLLLSAAGRTRRSLDGRRHGSTGAEGHWQAAGRAGVEHWQEARARGGGSRDRRHGGAGWRSARKARGASARAVHAEHVAHVTRARGIEYL